MQWFRSMKTLQKFSSVHAQVHNHFNQERHLVTRQVYKQSARPRWPTGVTRGVDRRLRAGMSRHTQTTAAPLTKPAIGLSRGDVDGAHDAAGGAVPGRRKSPARR